MVAAILLVAGLLPLDTPTAAGPAVLEQYEAARTRAGRDTDAHVRLALWCEAHGLRAERARHLALAVLIDPKNVAARGLMGLVDYRGKWQRAEAVPERVRTDADLAAVLAEYNARRARAARTVDAQWRLALWCEENGLEAEAQAHFTSVVRLDPAHAGAWKRLGCKKVGGRWVSAEQLAAEKAEAAAQKEANTKWVRTFAKYHGWLAGKDEAKRQQAETALEAITDPRAVPAVWAVFVGRDERGQARAVRILGRIDAPGVSRALAVLSVFSPYVEVRRIATETLRHRDLRDVVGWLIALIRKPVRYEIRPVGGPGSPGVLFVEGQQYNVQRLYAPPPMPNIPLFPGEPITYDAAGLPVVSRMVGLVNFTTNFQPLYGSLQEQHRALGTRGIIPGLPVLQGEGKLRQRYGTYRVGLATNVPVTQNVEIPIGEIALQYQAAAASAALQLRNDVAALEASNRNIQASNERVTGVLHDLTGQDFGEDQQSWMSWWVDEQGYVYRPSAEPPRPTVVQNVPLAVQPQGVPVAVTAVQSGSPTTSLAQTGHSCFRAGTPVRTLTGQVAIESIAVGDQVLVEDTATGSLSFQSILAVFHNRPAQLYQVDLGGETVWATGIHRFWKAGQGWTMARDLKPGDVVRTLGQTATVVALREGPVEPVYNLEVAHGHSFFVGAVGVLVHDNSLVQPTARPFDASVSTVTYAPTGESGLSEQSEATTP
jgi:hypothetical protein